MPGPRLSRGTVLRLAARVRLTIARDRLVVEGADDAVACDAALLPLLDRLRAPCTLGALFDALAPLPQREWIAHSAALLELLGAGAIESDGPLPAALRPDHGFGYLEPHIAMLADERRTRAYVEAIGRVVRAGDVVVDLGTGSGVLALAAARAGARRVYALERSGIADVAEQAFARNGLAERIVLVRDVSTRAVLPERADVLVSELLGSEPFAERVLEYTRDAVDRLVVAGGRVVPRRLRVFARAVSLPAAVVARHAAEPAAARGWQARYGFDFSALVDASARSARWFSVPTGEAAAWPALTPAVRLLEIDLADPPRPPLAAQATVAASAAGRLDAVVVFWELELDPQARFSTDPATADAACSWGNAVWLMPVRPAVAAGTALRLRFRYDAPHAMASVEQAGARGGRGVVESLRRADHA